MKDQVETRDMPTTYGSAVFKDFIPQRDATIVTRLKKAGAVIIAKTTMGEYRVRLSGIGVRDRAQRLRSDANRQRLVGRHRLRRRREFRTVGIGEDTGGSVRGPAAVNNLVGLRPTLPLVSRFGMMPARPTTDTLGPIARSVKDAAIVLDVIAGYDANDPVTAEAVGQLPADLHAVARGGRVERGAHRRHSRAARSAAPNRRPPTTSRCGRSSTARSRI